MPNKGWWGFDFDGTIAVYEGYGDGSIGAPIAPMIRRIKHYLKQGRVVKIVTARANFETLPREQYISDTMRIQQWCKEHIGQVLPITFKKDMHIVALFDDRAVQVITNKGILVREELRRAVLALQEIATYAAGVDDMELSELVTSNLKNLDAWSLDLAFNN